jgi:hypothetical protein
MRQREMVRPIIRLKCQVERQGKSMKREELGSVSQRWLL